MWSMYSRKDRTLLSWEKFMIALCFGLFPSSDKRWLWNAEPRLCSCPFSETVTTSWWRLACRAFFTIAFHTCQLCPAAATGTCSDLPLSSPSVAEQDTETALLFRALSWTTWTLRIKHSFAREMPGQASPGLQCVTSKAGMSWWTVHKPCVSRWAVHKPCSYICINSLASLLKHSSP